MLPLPKIWPRKALILTLLLGLSINHVHAEAEAEAEAEADPKAEAIPDPDPQFMMMPQMPQQMMPSFPAQRPPMSPCEMTNQCCGMANANCCVGGQKCYTTYDRKCETEDDPQCQMTVEQVCSEETMPACRLVTEVVEREFTGSICTPKPLTKCWSYEKKVCAPSTKSAFQDITWENEVLRVVDEKMREHCYDQTVFNCSENVYSDIVTKQVEKTRIVPDSRQQCRNVPIVGNSTTITMPVVSISYRTACYDIPAPRCSTSMCGTGTCGQGQSVCSRNDYNTQTVCPSGVNNPNQNCQQVQRPVCYGQGLQCNAGSQQCCGQQTQRVCRQVPERNVQQVSRVIPGQVTYERVCQTMVFNRTERYLEPEQQMVNRTRKECPSSIVNKCSNISYAEYAVVPEKKTQSVTVQLPECKHQTVQDRYCHTFPVGDMACRSTPIKKRFRISKLKCDGQEQRPICKKVPRLNCRLGSRNKCEMVPRRVCQKSCSDSPLCNQCNQFMQQGPGFGSCPSSGCGTIIPNTPWLPDDGSYENSGVTEFPGIGGGGFYPGSEIGGGEFYPGGEIGGGGSYPGNEIGGGSYYPGNGIGGGNYYPGNEIGGGGSYPGEEIGGGGSYPGQIGGGGSYPGDDMGGGSYPGQIGGGGSYPGDDMGGGSYPGQIGGGGFYPGGEMGGGSFPGQIGGGGSYPGSGVGGGGSYGGYEGFTADKAPAEPTSLTSENQEHNH
ncbi:uncharacterized protein LOC131884519 [Tigriopus californicus]|uniref:uncharacterized protein LOC131884519 n=1 Tax=Tigriopus californicus TaxID=6832 RepID=UPI0027DA7DFA|nr:uncharacterized protein LOC131884519 [Tigriopus californicus]